MKKLNLLLSVVFILMAFVSFAQPGADLKNPESGKCYAKCLIPAKYETVSVPVTIRAASMKVNISPATFADASEQILVKEGQKTYSATSAQFETASKSLLSKDGYKVLTVVPAVFKTETSQELVKEGYKVARVIPATYKNETFQLMVKPSYTTYMKKPAQYKTETETIETAPSNTKWVKKKSDDNCLSADPSDCMIWCLVEVPAEYRTVTKQVKVGCDDGWMMKGDDCVKAVKVDAVFKTYTKKVIESPARVEYSEVPAKFKTRSFQKLVSDARVEERTVAPVYKDWNYKRLASDAGSTESDIPAKYTNRSFKNLANDANLTESAIPEKVINVTKTNIVNPEGFTVQWKEVKCELVSYSPLPINWNLNSATLTNGSKKIINERLLPILKKGMMVELASHTDSRGSDTFNQDLSNRRANAVKKYLISKGINSNLLVAKGYGETRLKNNCSNGVSCSEAQHLENRRTEFRIINR